MDIWLIFQTFRFLLKEVTELSNLGKLLDSCWQSEGPERKRGMPGLPKSLASAGEIQTSKLPRKPSFRFIQTGLVP